MRAVFLETLLAHAHPDDPAMVGELSMQSLFREKPSDGVITAFNAILLRNVSVERFGGPKGSLGGFRLLDITKQRLRLGRENLLGRPGTLFHNQPVNA